jgi:hypothetical protein
MRRTRVIGTMSAALALVGTTAATTAGTVTAASPCAGAQAVCSTLATYSTGSFVLKVYAPKNAGISAFDIWTGKKPTALRPKAICKQHGKASGAQYQLADYYLSRCVETIKPGHFQTYCFTGGGGIPFLANPASLNNVQVDAGVAGSNPVVASGSASGCPASVSRRKVEHHK